MSRLWMRSFWALVAVSVGMCVASAAQAQGPGGFFGGGGGSTLFMLREEAVQKELELVPDQVEKLTKLGEKMREDMQAMFTGGRNQSQEERDAQSLHCSARQNRPRHKRRTSGSDARPLRRDR